MKFHFLFKNYQSGFGLTEAMLAAGLMGGVALMSAKLTSEMNKNAKGVEVKSEYGALHSDIRAHLTDQNAGEATFGPARIGGGGVGMDITSCTGVSTAAAPAACQVPSINVPGATATVKWQGGSYSANGTTGKNSGFTTQNLIEIDSMWLSNFVRTGGTAAGVAGTGEIQLNIRYENLGFKERATGVRFILKQIPIRVTYNATDNITSAGAASGSGGDKWLDIADMTGIYYNGGGVQVGLTGNKVFDGASLVMGTGNTTTSQNSGAFGTSNKAGGSSATIGQSSFAIGHGSIAYPSTGSSGSGGFLNATAIGRGNTASGSESTALGYGNVVTNRFGMALGTANYSLGYASYVLGSWNIATGQNAVAIGYFSESHGFASHAIGSYSKAAATGSMTLADYSTSSNYMVNNVENSLMARFVKGYSFITETNPVNTILTPIPQQGLYVKPGGNVFVGESNRYINTSASTVTGSNNFAVGMTNTVSGQSSAAIGAGNTVTGSLALGLGYLNKIGTPGTSNGWSSMGIGAGNTINGGKSVGIGWNNVIPGDNSYAVGAASTASGDYSLALGVRAEAGHWGSVVLSNYPTSSYNLTSGLRTRTARIINASGTAYTNNNNYGCNNSASCSVGGDNSFTARFRGGYHFYTNDPSSAVPTTGVFLGPGANAWGSVSDKTKKEDFQPIDSEELLAKIAGLEIVKWKYIGSKHQHMGPMAQDFYKAFKLGDGNDRIITTQDIEGVTIAGVQALEKRTKELQKENEDLKQRIERLEAFILQNKK